MHRHRFSAGIVAGVLFGGLLTAALVAKKNEKQTFQQILIDKNAPGAYVSFHKKYVSDYKVEGESGTRAIFRLHNNYSFPININVYNVEDEDLLIEQSKVNVVGVDYDLIEYSGGRRAESLRHFGEEVMTMVNIDPGGDLFFFVPIEHLTSLSEIWIPFEIESEVNGTKGGLPPQHFAVFWGSHMPKVQNRRNK